MKYIPLGKSGIKISAVGLGCMGMTHAYGKPADEAEMVRLIHAALDMGVTLFDTAECYTGMDERGNTVYNEELVGKALKPFRNKAVIATKFGIRHNADRSLATDSRPETIRKSVDSSLMRLGTDHIDLYYQHRIDPNIPPEEIAGVMQDLIRAGKIRAWGVSEADAEYIRKANQVCHLDAIQNRYSMMYRNYGSLLPLLEELGITFVAHSPLANGFLSGKYNDTSTFDGQFDYRSAMPQFKAGSMDKNKALFAMLNAMAEEKYASPAQLSLAWLIAKGIVPIPGTRKRSRLEENSFAADIVLAPQEISAIDNALEHMEMSEVFGGHKTN